MAKLQEVRMASILWLRARHKYIQLMEWHGPPNAYAKYVKSVKAAGRKLTSMEEKLMSVLENWTGEKS